VSADHRIQKPEAPRHGRRGKERKSRQKVGAEKNAAEGS